MKPLFPYVDPMENYQITEDVNPVPLKEIAAYAGFKEDEILVAAAEGKLHILFEVPLGNNIVLQPKSYAYPFEKPFFGFPNLSTRPEYLILRRKFCDQLQRSNFVEVTDASGAYRRTAYSQLSGEAVQIELLPAWRFNGEDSLYPVELVNKPNLPPNSYPQWHRWVLWSNGDAAYIRVRKDDLLVFQSEFFSWVGLQKDQKESSEYFLASGKHVKDLPDDFKSPQLLRMCEAAFKLWGNERVIADDPSTHPSNQYVIDWLLKSDAEFTKTAAKNAAALIKPVFANRAGAPEKKK